MFSLWVYLTMHDHVTKGGEGSKGVGWINGVGRRQISRCAALLVFLSTISGSQAMYS